MTYSKLLLSVVKHYIRMIKVLRAKKAHKIELRLRISRKRGNANYYNFCQMGTIGAVIGGVITEATKAAEAPSKSGVNLKKEECDD